jgi:glucose/arabinose dehydrogenase
VVSRFAVDQGNPDIADSSSEEIILEIGQPFSNHNGGQIAFGPDGYLYIGLGDGGSRSDPQGNGQDITTLLGSILRIDVAQIPDGRNYTVPPSNPFVDIPGAKGEIWAYGFRNPWRFSFDQKTGEMWVADVGQDAWEEVSLVLKGGNYGWNVLEGHACYKPRQGCSVPPDAAAPLIVYDHKEGCSVTGGYVYRGSQFPNLVGTYIYGDFCSGTIWGFRDSTAETAENTVLAQTDLAITSFGQDVEGELYLVSQDQGIYQLFELP